MHLEENLAEERSETVKELSGLFVIVQEMGRRLANETHGEAYDLVRELNELLHQTRAKINQIEQHPEFSSDPDRTNRQ
jgi:hypothetical protein